MPGAGGRPRSGRRLSEPNRRIFGLDFSGAVDAGRRAWLAEGRPTPDGLEILSCRPVSALPGGAIDRATALAALRSFIAGTPDAIIGCDFPFSLPRAHIEAASWPDFIDGFRHADALTFYEHCRRSSCGKEPKRATDVESKTPWCAFNIRLYRQSFHGMAELLRPLVTEGKALVLPMQSHAPGLPWLIETCPASALRHFGWRGSYKGAALGEQRRNILHRLTEAGLLRPLPQSLQALVADNPGGDALDSMVAALAAARALDDIVAGGADGDALEGRVYFHLG
jgi:Protein of unknown function (DUF429)